MKQELVINLRRSGATYGSISKALGISKSTAHKYCKGISVNRYDAEPMSNERSKKRSFEAEYEDIRKLYAVANMKLEYLTKSNTSLEQQVYELRRENERFSKENSDLILNVRTADREKEIAVKQALLDYKTNNNSGLGALTDPQFMDNLGKVLIAGIDLLKTHKAEKRSTQNERNDLSQAKKGALDYFLSKLISLSDDQSNKLLWLNSVIIENNKIEECFVNWQKKPE